MTNQIINLMPSWENLHRMCRDGEFPKIYEELLKPCLLADEINKHIDKGFPVKIYKDENGTVILESDDPEE